MKKLLIFLLILTLGLALVACGSGNDPCTEHVDADSDGKCDKCDAAVKPDVAPGDLVLVEDYHAKFSVVSANSLSNKASGYIQNFVVNLNGYHLRYEDLRQNYDAPGFDDVTEIIFGPVVNRGDAFKKDEHYLGHTGFSVELVGNKLFVLAGGDDGYRNAVEYLEKTIFGIDETGNEKIAQLVVAAGTKYESVTTDYDITEITIDGTGVDDFVLAFDKSHSGAWSAALILQDTFYKKAGVWLPYVALNKVTDGQKVIYVENTKGDKERRTDNGCTIYVRDGDLHIECEFENKFEDFVCDFIDSKLSRDKVKISSDYTYSKDVRNIYYKDFGAVGDGITDDFFAIMDCHDYANLYGHTVNSDGPDKTYYIGNYLNYYDSKTSVSVQTDTNWHGCTFIFDDSVVEPNTPCYNSPIFEIRSSYLPIRYAGLSLKVNSLKKGASDLGGWAPGYECLIYIENTNLRHYIRYGLNENNGSAQHEIIYVHADGTIDPSTPLQWDYEVVTSLTVYPCDTEPITVSGGDGDQRVTIRTIFNSAPSRYTYYQRNIRITRSNVTLQNINHEVVGEVPESSGGTGAPYGGFTKVEYANNVTIQNMLIHNLVGYHLETNKSNGMGTYELNAAHANNILWKNIKQDVFFDVDGGVSYEGLMGTNYCKNLVFDGNFICSFDAHCGVYNGTIKNSIIEHLNFIGDGLITIENTTLYLDGSRTAIQLRSDYGATWRGDVYMKDVDLKYEIRKNKTVSLISSSWTNHSFGYTCYLPQDIYIENVRMLGFTVTVTNGVRDEQIVDVNKKKIYLFTPGTVYNYTSVDISDPEAVMSSKPNDWKKCTCATRPDSEFKNPDTASRGFNDTDGDGRCNNSIVGPSQQSVWCWGFEETPDKTVNANPYIGTKSVTVVNKDPSNPLNIVWPLTPQFKDMDVTVDGVVIIEDGAMVD